MLFVASYENIVVRGPFLYPTWHAPYGDGRRAVEQTQLLVCVDFELWRDAPPQTVTCEYDFDDVQLDVYESTYHVSIREATSGALVGEFDASGNVSDQNSCPFGIEYFVGSEPDLARGLGSESFEDQLRPYIEAAW